MLEIIIGCIVVIAIFLIIITIYYNKFQFVIIKIDEALNNIDTLLDKKRELLERTRPVIKKEIKFKDYLDGIDSLNKDELNNFELNDILKKFYNELFKVLDDNEKLFKSESLVSIVEEINDNEEKIIGSIKFYNDSVVSFNHLVAVFPSCVIAFFCRYKKKEFYNNEKREMYEILNDK